MSAEMSGEDYLQTLNGFDEIAVAKAFGAKPFELSETDAMGLLRALYFVAKRREGLEDKAAKQAAMEATIREVNDFFPEDEPEPMPEDPITESGKDEPEPQPTPSDSPSSVSEPASSPPSTTP